ncbi:hypothetical protein RRG08_046059 [Elysia crispata]|uniref:Uncharacterized protein n=1 Tax=Elysia crispata TaxID=231223 RepID=A0AAE1DUY8_9GAST|nr:hypothetical protein RRG08_046059 [Elysia crispata]
MKSQILIAIFHRLLSRIFPFSPRAHRPQKSSASSAEDLAQKQPRAITRTSQQTVAADDRDCLPSQTRFNNDGTERNRTEQNGTGRNGSTHPSLGLQSNPVPETAINGSQAVKGLVPCLLINHCRPSCGPSAVQGLFLFLFTSVSGQEGWR